MVTKEAVTATASEVKDSELDDKESNHGSVAKESAPNGHKPVSAPSRSGEEGVNEGPDSEPSPPMGSKEGITEKESPPEAVDKKVSADTDNDKDLDLSEDIGPHPGRRDDGKLESTATPAKLTVSEGQGNKEKRIMHKPYPAQQGTTATARTERTSKATVSKAQSNGDKPTIIIDKAYPAQKKQSTTTTAKALPSSEGTSKAATPLNENGKRSAASLIADVEPMDIEDFYRIQVQLANLPDPPQPPAPEMPLQVLDGDVIFGRGGTSNHHRGNIRYRMLVKTYQRIYLQAKRHDKPKIAMLIVETIRREKGRFLKKNEMTQQWHDVGNSKAREKTSQALREKAPEIRAENGFSKYPTKRDKAKSPLIGFDMVKGGMNFGAADTAMLIATRQTLAGNKSGPRPYKKRKTNEATLEELAVSEELRALREKMSPEKPNPSKPPTEI